MVLANKIDMLPPSPLYKYVTAETAELVLKSSRLRWSRPSLFNDVSEFQRMPRFEPTIVEAFGLIAGLITSSIFTGPALNKDQLNPQIAMIVSAAEQLVARGKTQTELLQILSLEGLIEADKLMAEELRRHVTNEINAARILCMTADCNNDAMWVHYAAQHKGCVLGFRSVEGMSSPWTAARPILYSEQAPIVGSGLDFLIYKDKTELLAKTTEAVYFTKKQHWAYEQEWRLMTKRPEEADREYGDYKFLAAELESVTLGINASPETESTVRKLLAEYYPFTHLYKMRHFEGELMRQLVIDAEVGV